MRVLHLVTSDAYAGLERHVLQLARELRHLGCEAEIACPRSADLLRADARATGVPLHPRSGDQRRLWLGGVAREMRRCPPDILHVHDGRSAIAALGFAPRVQLVRVRTQHFTRPASVERGGWHGRLSRQLQRRLNARLDGYIAVSRSAAEAAVKRRETASAEVVVIPSGVELAPEHLVARARARRSREEPLVAYIGRLEAEKELEVLIDAIPMVRAEQPACRFVIAGSGAVEDDLKAHAAEIGLNGAIDWPGWIPGPRAVLERAHVYVNTWPWEGFGMAMAEAMSYGIPVVAVDSAASTEMVQEGVTGHLVPPGNPQALAEAIIDLVRDHDRASSLGEAARRRAAHYGADRTARATLDLYERLVARR